MDHQPDLGPAPTIGEETVWCDQAVFTSIRTCRGEGYRIIAASSGVRADERVAITRYSPSHGRLYDSTSAAVGLASYLLTSDRHCVAHCRYAGTEHTGRGGRRVHTHSVLLDRWSFRRFGCNPARVHAALVDRLGDSPMLDPSPQLDPLSLPLPPSPDVLSPAQQSGAADPSEVDCVCHVVSVLLAGRSLIVVGSKKPLELVECVLLALPLWIRQSVSVTVGLKFSPARKVQLVVTNRDDDQARRAIEGHDVHWFDVRSPAAKQASPYDRWLELIRQWLAHGRLGDLAELTSELTTETSPGDLDRLASIHIDR